MVNNLAHTIRLYPNKEQETFFKKACGCARVAYNYGLAEYQRQYAAGQKPKIGDIKKQFNSIKEDRYPWIYETNKDANLQPFTNLQNAFNRFFKKLGKYPKFKKKGIKDSFYISNDKFQVDGTKYRIPKLGWVKGAEELRFKGKIMSATVKRRAGYWFVVVSVEAEISFAACENQAVVGVDLGVKTLATLSDGIVFEKNDALRRNMVMLKRQQRTLSRRVKGSKNRRKQIRKVAKIHYQVSCIRKDVLDKLTTHLCKNYQTICIEDLNVAGMVKNRKLALSISDAGFGEFRKQLEYKSKLHGNDIKLVNRWFPSSNTCSVCGAVKHDLTLKDRIYICPSCGLEIDRDLNAAINIKCYGLNNNKLGMVNPEVTPVEMVALACRAASETTVDESGILACAEKHM